MKKTIEPKYRPLEKEFTRHTYLFKLVRREGLVAIYETLDAEDNNRPLGYEVFEVIQMEAGFAGPAKYPQPAREVVPGNEAWGVKGFSPRTIQEAEARFTFLQAKLTERASAKEEGRTVIKSRKKNYGASGK